MKKNQPTVMKKFNTPYRISGNCKNCTPDKPDGRTGGGHNSCFNVNCICPHHPGGAYFATQEHRNIVLRTGPKPGDFDYKP